MFRGCVGLCKDVGHSVMGALKPDAVIRDLLVTSDPGSAPCV